MDSSLSEVHISLRVWTESSNLIVLWTVSEVEEGPESLRLKRDILILTNEFKSIII